jgi:hypothetical protein
MGDASSERLFNIYAQEELPFMDRFIDVYYLPDVDSYTPYRCFIWQSGSIVYSTQHETIADTAQWCKDQALLVRAHNAQVRAQLRAHGVDAQPPVEPPSDEKAVGDD